MTLGSEGMENKWRRGGVIGEKELGHINDPDNTSGTRGFEKRKQNEMRGKNKPRADRKTQKLSKLEILSAHLAR